MIIIGAGVDVLKVNRKWETLSEIIMNLFIYCIWMLNMGRVKIKTSHKYYELIMLSSYSALCISDLHISSSNSH